MTNGTSLQHDASMQADICPEDTQSVSFIQLLHILHKQIITIFVVFGATIAIVVGYTMMQPVEYTATVQLFATGNGNNSNTGIGDRINGNAFLMEQIRSYPALAKTKVVLQPVIDDLKLETSSTQLAQQINVINPIDTAFLNISATDSQPKLAARIANAVAESLSNVVEKSLYPNGISAQIKLTSIQPAQVPATSSTPKWRYNITLAVLGGLVLGVLAALVKSVLSKTVHNDTEITDIIDVPIIGRLPSDQHLVGNGSVIISASNSPVSDDFRRIGTNLSFTVLPGNTGCRLMAITSTGASEGKTTVAVNTAAALAENGARVLLIDTDLRNPSVAKKLGIDDSAGLTHVLSGQAAVKDVVQQYWKTNLHVMPAGPKAPNASALLNSPLMEELLKNASLQYDYVVADTTPMMVAKDPVLFVREGGFLLMVCRLGKTQKEDLYETSVELTTLGIPISGLIVNYEKIAD
ncbi:Chain length regulator (capsular polysaccharide biosynthesis) [Bifidobacterium animalis subsp. animalis]|nr:Chain length regulator (capsular polysaccharide biosynthesis) [Bifidobacterium animalis subsp. animalis]